MKPLVLGEGDTLGSIECIRSSRPQTPGHVGVGHCFSNKFNTVEEAQQWLSKHKENPYVSVVAAIDHLEQKQYGEYNCTSRSYHWQTLFEKDIPPKPEESEKS